MIKGLAKNKVLWLNCLMILTFGLLVFFIAGYWNVPDNTVKLVLRLVIAVFFLGISLTLKRINSQSDNWKLFYVFFCCSVCFSFSQPVF